ncbi:DUF1523 family protein [Candidatus Halocynthiibacter alkanivorans]|uniref:DUF1523 family protein n=1 Tax=Candidatus Halocynthiibacter alkanivorans TaxID=2267619 RepID=UPI000DF1945A|nr:DUF1523 family protein [Candidatus Halocynthiibacter alkanivorans]
MRKVKLALMALIALLIFSFLHYTLPQRDIVRVTNTEVRRVDFGSNSIFWAAADTGTATQANRDVRFIEAFYPNGKPMVFRNEDTGWGWPPYFKLDSSNLQAEARDFVSTKEAPQWVAISHYGWRNEYFTIYPNAVGVKPVAGPDVVLVPWLNIVILVLLALGLLLVVRMWMQFRERMIDPLVDNASAAMAGAEDRASGVWSRFVRWLGTWKGKPRK